MYQPTPYFFWRIIHLDGVIIYYVIMMFCLCYIIYPVYKIENKNVLCESSFIDTLRVQS